MQNRQFRENDMLLLKFDNSNYILHRQLRYFIVCTEIKKENQLATPLHCIYLTAAGR